MSFNATDLAKICDLGAPVLFVDTCTILDIVRDITRETYLQADAAASISILKAAETGTELVVCLASQVTTELAANLADVEDEARKRLAKYLAEARRIDAVATVFGAAGSNSTSHLVDHVARAKIVMNRWPAIAVPLQSDTVVVAAAWQRVGNARAPARKGKESMKDCVVVETYLHAAKQLRSAGLTSKLVFASSNTKEFHQAGTSHLHPDLAADFGPLNLEYAPNHGAARHLFGI
jgi:hypothetical protein